MTEIVPVPILFTHYGDEWIRGSERVLLDLLTHLDLARVRPIVWCNRTALAEATRAAGFLTYCTEFTYYFDLNSSPFSLRRYRSLVREGLALVRTHGIRVLHANSAAPAQWLVPVARTARLPLLAHLHIDYLRRSRYVFLLHQTTLLVGVSKQVLADFARDGMPPGRMRVIHNGIDFARLRSASQDNPRHRLGIADDAVVISAIGSLIRRKGQDVLIRAFKLLDTGRDPHLLVISDGPERSSLEALAAQLDLQDRVHFLGHFDFDDLPAIYGTSDIVALASRAEAFGLVLAEAGYFALPVVATTVGGIPEVVEHGSTGLLVPPDDPEALAAALSRLIGEPDYRRELGRAAKDRVERLFGVDRMAANFHDAYEYLAQLPRSRSGWSRAAISLTPYLNLLRPQRAGWRADQA